MSKLRSMLLLVLPALWLVNGCGGPAQASPTAIPASVVRPVQPTPVYSVGANVFTVLTPQKTPQFAPTDASGSGEADPSAADGARAAIALIVQDQTPSAVGIAPGGAAIYAERGGRTVASLPPGGVVTVTGKSSDGSWYSVYNDDAAFGWTPAGQLRVYGGEDLIVVEEAPNPAPIATLLARAGEPVRVLDDLLAQMEADATAAVMAVAQQPATPSPAALAATPALPGASAASELESTVTPMPAAELPESSATGVVNSDERLNLRTQANTNSAIIRKLAPGEEVTILQGGNDGWLRVQAGDGSTGWVAAEFVTEFVTEQ